eukprot:TRINITY_DN2636_c0_g1_i1.p4 TRINITY_DN2636_c0_g1~~TRINITY_DN2636_c0_g1_i1.p4  ORF type:complete len:102 (+),score=1.52 TRINITY_DN2636_c0_g1_i1:543-848(+)
MLSLHREERFPPDAVSASQSGWSVPGPQCSADTCLMLSLAVSASQTMGLASLHNLRHASTAGNGVYTEKIVGIGWSVSSPQCSADTCLMLTCDMHLQLVIV